MAVDIVLCTWARHFTLTVTISNPSVQMSTGEVNAEGNPAMDLHPVQAKKVEKVKNCKIKKKFRPNVFRCLPSSGLKMTVRTHAYISYVTPVGKRLNT